MEKSSAQASRKRVRYSRHDGLPQRVFRMGANDATPQRAEHQTCPAIRQNRCTGKYSGQGNPDVWLPTIESSFCLCIWEQDSGLWNLCNRKSRGSSPPQNDDQRTSPTRVDSPLF